MTLNFAATIGDNTEATIGASCGTGTIYTVISQSGAMTLSIGTSAVTLISTTIALIGNVTIAVGKDLHKNVAGPFASGTGAVSLIGATVALNSNVTIAADKGWHKNVASPFSSGTGAVSLIGATVALNSDVTIAADKGGVPSSAFTGQASPRGWFSGITLTG